MDTLLTKIEKFVFELFKNELANTFLYHNFLHTQRVVESTKELIENLEVGPQDTQCLIIAAWFHDTGYVKTVEGHEQEGTKIATTFLEAQQVDQDTIAKVKGLILVTKLDKKPMNLLEEIIKDADTSHLAKEYFGEVSELLRQELSIQGRATYTPAEWRRENIILFSERHQYYTVYAVNTWEPKKNTQLISFFKKKKKGKKKRKQEILKAKLKAKYKDESPERATQTLYRVTLRNHIKLSDIADTKANILLSVNAIIISLALANLIPKLDSPTNQHLLLPTLILVLFSVASIVLSIMSTQPKVTSGEFTEDQIKNKKVNLLFFGNFYRMPYEQYLSAMNNLILSKTDIYEMLTKDLYLLGVVLNKKYKILKITYVVFTIGIILSVLTFIIAFNNLEIRDIERIITE